jgi:hypothetical protein
MDHYRSPMAVRPPPLLLQPLTPPPSILRRSARYARQVDFGSKAPFGKAGQPLSVFPDAPTIQDPIRTSSLGQMADIVEH